MVHHEGGDDEEVKEVEKGIDAFIPLQFFGGDSGAGSKESEPRGMRRPLQP